MSLSDGVKKFSETSKKRIDFVNMNLTLQLGESCVFLSPVDTGRFRSNWRFEVDKNDRGFDMSYIESKQSTLDRIAVKIDGIDKGKSFYITNNLPYAIPLENGHSEQRPTGIVKVTFKKRKKFFDNAVKEAKRQIG